jgi:hypothetical protein
MLKLDHTKLSHYEFTEDMIFTVTFTNFQHRYIGFEVVSSNAIEAYLNALDKAKNHNMNEFKWVLESIHLKDSVKNCTNELKKYQTD